MPSPHAVYEQDNSVVYKPERYGGQIILDVVRRKGSTGTIQVSWEVIIQTTSPGSLVVTPMSGELKFLEGQWDSSIYLQFPVIPRDGQGATTYVTFDKISGGAMLGNFSDVKILFTSEVPSTEDHNSVLKIILPTVAGVLVLIVIILIVVFVVNRRRRYNICISVQCNFTPY